MSAETRQDDAVDTLAVMLEFSQMPHVTDDQIMIETLASHLASTRDALRDVIQDATANADERDAAIARAEAAERVVAQLTEDIERRLVMGVGTISSQHVLRMIGRPWTFEDVSERRLHGSETLSSE